MAIKENLRKLYEKHGTIGYRASGVDLTPDQVKQIKLTNALGQAGMIDNDYASKIFSEILLNPPDKTKENANSFQEKLALAEAYNAMGKPDLANQIVTSLAGERGLPMTQMNNDLTGQLGSLSEQAKQDQIATLGEEYKTGRSPLAAAKIDYLQKGGSENDLGRLMDVGNNQFAVRPESYLEGTLLAPGEDLLYRGADAIAPGDLFDVYAQSNKLRQQYPGLAGFFKMMMGNQDMSLSMPNSPRTTYGLTQ